MEYRLTGAQDPSSRIDRVRVEGPSENFPEGKVLTLGGAPAELSNEQVARLSNYVRLEAVKGATAASATVDQPGVPATSHSTDVPPDPGRVPQVTTLTKDELVGELGRVRHQDPAALPELSERSNKDDLQKGLANYYGQEV